LTGWGKGPAANLGRGMREVVGKTVKKGVANGKKNMSSRFECGKGDKEGT